MALAGTNAPAYAQTSAANPVVNITNIAPSPARQRSTVHITGNVHNEVARELPCTEVTIKSSVIASDGDEYADPTMVAPVKPDGSFDASFQVWRGQRGGNYKVTATCASATTETTLRITGLGLGDFLSSIFPLDLIPGAIIKVALIIALVLALALAVYVVVELVVGELMRAR